MLRLPFGYALVNREKHRLETEKKIALRTDYLTVRVGRAESRLNQVAAVMRGHADA